VQPSESERDKQPSAAQNLAQVLQQNNKIKIKKINRQQKANLFKERELKSSPDGRIMLST
jgi:hypothetical protein